MDLAGPFEASEKKIPRNCFEEWRTNLASLRRQRVQGSVTRRSPALRHFLAAAFVPFSLSCFGFLLFLSFFWLLLPLPMLFSFGNRKVCSFTVYSTPVANNEHGRLREFSQSNIPLTVAMSCSSSSLP